MLIIKTKKCIGVFLDLVKTLAHAPHEKLLNVSEDYRVRGATKKEFETSC